MQYLNYIFMTLLILHVLGEYYFQNTELADRVEKGWRWNLFHIIVYAIIFLLAFLIMPGLPPLYYAELIVAHAGIELVSLLILKYKYEIIAYKEKVADILEKELGSPVKGSGSTYQGLIEKAELMDLIVFTAHLVLHVLLFVFLSFTIREIEVGPLYNNRMLHLLNELGMKGSVAICRLIKILILCKPGGTLIAMLLKRYKSDKVTGGKSVGKYIGYLERICILIFMSIGQYSSVGLVLTAKSIARYNEIANDRDFAEYYLLGTLLSTILAVAISLFFKL